MDGAHLARCAARLHALAEEARGEAARVAATDAVAWRSVAADRFRVALRQEAVLGRRCAEALDAAAQAFAAHARAIGSAR
jgi:hypothetical protein